MNTTSWLDEETDAERSQVTFLRSRTDEGKKQAVVSAKNYLKFKAN